MATASSILGFRAANYALNIIMYGTNRLTTRNGFVGVAAGYYTPIEQYAASNFRRESIENALAMTWINDLEYSEIIELIPVVIPVVTPVV